ncbi:MAG: peptidoglycan DD-metalloendopeptidase family protein [Tidjanibacter sp.]|nr:peptidoglycan DD-metalloendopeptidase family protein [Tidjanibacter sp.]
MCKRLIYKVLFVGLAILVWVLPISAQTTIDELNAEIRRAEKEIAEGEELLSKINKDQSVNSQQIKLLQSRINNRNSIIRSLESQISLTNRDINSREKNIKQLEADLAQIKKEYGDMVYTSYKNHKLNNSLLFLFSSRDFNDMTRRLDYMRRYNAMREEKARDIDTLRNQLSAEVEQLTVQRESLNTTRKSRDNEVAALQKDKNQYSEANNRLGRQANDVTKKIQEQQRVKQRAEAELQRIIAEEARKNQKAQGSLNEEERRKLTELSGRFDQNKGKLPYPVTGGVIVDHFGVHPHPTQPRLTVNNKGINIAAKRGASVYCVFEGVVTRVLFINGLNNCVMVRHGEYYTVYSNLASVSVKNGDIVALDQKLGTLSNGDNSDEYTLHFELWKGTDYLNPEQWLAK